jgi:GTP-binding protein
MIDLAEIQIHSGSGGNGAVSYRREKFVPMGGPDGGDGGNGGDVLMQADEGLTTLAHFRHRRMYKAQAGTPGGGQKRHGANGKPLLLKVPVGTVIRSEDAVWDLDEHGETVIVARGGEGGRGNSRFANSIRQAPGFAEHGLPGEELHLRLELKLLADVGLVGLPNAGKSTLLRAVSNAIPDVGDFPFTTLEPVLGVVDMGLDTFVMADLPGLIEGAHEGVGLGLQFLRHVERTRVILHVLDASAADPVGDYETVQRELALYDASIVEKPEIVLLNKMDLPDARENAESLKKAFADKEVMLVSGATGEGTRELLQRLMRIMSENRPAPSADPAAEAEIPVLRPRGRERLEINWLEDGVFEIRGARAEEDALKLGESGPEALDELQERLKRMGLEKGLRRAGAKPGDMLRIGEVKLEWYG